MAVLTLAGPTQQERPLDTSANAVVKNAAAYVRQYQQDLKYVIADEATVQEVFDADGNRTARRETSGEFFLAYVKADRAWLAVRDVAAVDGLPLPGRDSLQVLLKRGSFTRIGRQIANRNARFNLGSVNRNFNDPMLALVMLDDRHRSRFRFNKRSEQRTA